MLFLSRAGVYSFKTGLDSYLLYFVLASFENKIYFCAAEHLSVSRVRKMQHELAERERAKCPEEKRLTKYRSSRPPLTRSLPGDRQFGFDVVLCLCLMAGTGSHGNLAGATGF